MKDEPRENSSLYNDSGVIYDRLDTVEALLKEPFDEKELRFRAGSIRRDKTKCMVFAYIDARAVMDRLDDTVGVANWQTQYTPSPNGVFCELIIKIEGDWIAKSDIGVPSDFEAGKGAVSDSLKRAAVQWGIGRYLYRFPTQWTEFDGRNISGSINVPAFATTNNKAYTIPGKPKKKPEQKKPTTQQRKKKVQKKEKVIKKVTNEISAKLKTAGKYTVPDNLPLKGTALSELVKTEDGMTMLKFLSGQEPNLAQEHFNPASDQEKKLMSASKFILKNSES